MASEVLKSTKKSRFINCGFNPGCIQSFFKLGLKEYAKTRHKKLIKGNYARLAHELGLKEVIISEYDSQKSKSIKSTPKKFVNTWSCVGYELEAADHAMLSLSNAEIAAMEADGIRLIAPDEGNAQNIRFLEDLGMDVERESITLDDKGNPFEFKGALIPHAEIASMSEFLSYNGDAPSIMYIYRSCDESLEGLKYLRENKYHPLKDFHVLELDEIEPGGYDSIGALMTFENGDKIWCGSVLDTEQVRKLGFRVANPTGVQVAGFLHANIAFIMENPKYGLNTAETIPHRELFLDFADFMGSMMYRRL